MKSNQLSKLNDWMQVIAGLAVLIGILLVFQELRQNNNIASADRISDLYMEGSEIRRFTYENQTLLLLQKAVEQPDDLSGADIAQLDSFFEIMWNLHAHQVAVARLGLLSASLEDAAQDFAWYCQSRLCRVWFEHNKEWLASEPLLFETVLSELENMPVPTRFQYLIDLKSAP